MEDRTTGRSHKYIKFVLTMKDKSKKKWCGLLENRTEDAVVRDFLETLHEPYVWTPNTKKIWLESGTVEYIINTALEFTPGCFMNVKDDSVYLFPNSNDFLDHLDRNVMGELIVYCYSPFDNEYHRIPITAFYELMPFESHDIFTFMRKLCGNWFSMTRPASAKIPFSDRYECINTNYRKLIKTEGKLTIL